MVNTSLVPRWGRAGNKTLALDPGRGELGNEVSVHVVFKF